MENSARDALLAGGVAVLAGRGAAGLTLRAVEDRAGLAHGSVRHHFGDRDGLIAALFTYLATQEEHLAQGSDVVATLQHWLGPGRALTLARYEMFLLAARNPRLRAPLLAGRQRFVAIAASQVGEEAAPTLVAALDGVLLDALVRGSDTEALAASLRHLAARAQGSA